MRKSLTIIIMKGTKQSETNTENIFRDFYGSKTFIEKSAIPTKYGFVSKKGTKNEGYPDFFLDVNSDYVIVVEAKPLDFEQAKEEVQFYMGNNKINKEKNIIGMAVAGQSEEKYKVAYYFLRKNSNKICSIPGTTLRKVDDISRTVNKLVYGDTVSDEALTTILSNLNGKFHENKVRDTDRSLFFSGIMIALCNSNFRSIYKSIKAPSDEEKASIKVNLLDAHYLNDAILKAVKTELEGKINNLSKEFLWSARFAFITTIDIDLDEYKNIIELIEKDIFIPFKNQEKQDLLGRAYKIFLKRQTGRIDNKNIILTPDHIKHLMVQLARLSKKDVVLDTCTGSGGFLMESMEEMIAMCKNNESEIKHVKEHQLIGFETDPVLFALACSNMFLHGDGKTNMIYRSSLLDISNKQDKLVFEAIRNYKPTKVIINPPYEKNNPILFTKQAIDYLESNGSLVIIMPNNILTKDSRQKNGSIINDILSEARLDYVIKLPVAIFKEQKRIVYTSIYGFTKTPHRKDDEVLFYTLENDGLVSIQHKGRIDKYKRWDAIEKQILDCIFNKKEIDDVCEKRKLYNGDVLMCNGVQDKVVSTPNSVPFGDLFNVGEKGTLQSENADPDGDVDFITASEQWKKHTEASHDTEAIIYATGAEGSLGRAHYVNGKFIASNLCLILTPKNQSKYPVDLEFYSFYLMSIRKKLVGALADGMSKLTIDSGELSKYPIEYFDINKQGELKKAIKERIKEVKEMEKKLQKHKDELYVL